MKTLERIVAFVVAGILLQTLYFKFTGAPESVAIFTQLGVEPFGRIGAGISELIAAALLLYPKTTKLGALATIGIMLGAIGAHIFVLGIAVADDGGLLFALASVCFAGSTWLYFRMKAMPLFMLFFFLMSCEPQEATPKTPANDQFDESKAILIKQGTWSGAGGHDVSGTVKLYQQADGKHILLMESFSSTNGPDLKVYLSADDKASSFISLGALKSVAGKQLYELPSKAESHPFALIWCERFSVLFGKAAMM